MSKDNRSKVSDREMKQKVAELTEVSLRFLIDKLQVTVALSKGIFCSCVSELYDNFAFVGSTGCQCPPDQESRCSVTNFATN